MNDLYYIGLDVHKKTITYTIKTPDGALIEQARLPAQRAALRQWAGGLERPFVAALEATMFSGWVWDELQPHAQELQLAHPQQLEAITKAKKKNDRLDSDKICDLLRCDLLPGAYMMPSELRELRRLLRYRNLLVSEAVRLKNKTASLLMEVGEPYDAGRLHQKGYFYRFLRERQEIPPSVRRLLAISRLQLEMFLNLERQLLRELLSHPLLQARVQQLRTIEGVGEVLGLSWALEVGEVERFGSIGRAVSYCGLCSRQQESGGKSRRGPLSKQRNKHLQRVLIEAAKLAPRYNATLREVQQRELGRGHRNRATVAVARKLVAYLLAVDRRWHATAPQPEAA
jgi:transposase